MNSTTPGDRSDVLEPSIGVPTTGNLTCTTNDARGTANKEINNANPLQPGTVSLAVEDGTFRLRYLIIFGQQ